MQGSPDVLLMEGMFVQSIHEIEKEVSCGLTATPRDQATGVIEDTLAPSTENLDLDLDLD